MNDTLAELKALGVTLPGPGYLIGVLLFGVIGMVAFYLGRKRKQRSVKWLGVALMLYPYVVWGTVPLYVVGVILSAALAWEWRKHGTQAV